MGCAGGVGDAKGRRVISGANSKAGRELAAQLARQFGKGRRAGPAAGRGTGPPCACERATVVGTSSRRSRRRLRQAPGRDRSRRRHGTLRGASSARSTRSAPAGSPKHPPRVQRLPDRHRDRRQLAADTGETIRRSSTCPSRRGGPRRTPETRTSTAWPARRRLSVLSPPNGLQDPGSRPPGNSWAGFSSSGRRNSSSRRTRSDRRAFVPPRPALSRDPPSGSVRGLGASSTILATLDKPPLCGRAGSDSPNGAPCESPNGQKATPAPPQQRKPPSVYRRLLLIGTIICKISASTSAAIWRRPGRRPD
jgi:hypothetical protein